MNSLYECDVSHCRLKPKRHAFDYRVFMLCVDLDELPGLSRSLCGFSHNRFNLFSIDDRDHVNFGLPGGIRGNLTKWLAEQGEVFPTDARIQLVTFPRVFGYGFNPVSFYYIQARGGEILAVVAEVVNTFREMKLYLIDSTNTDGLWHRRVAKDFYVSPFSDPGMEFEFNLGMPHETWRVNIDTYGAGERILLSSIRGGQKFLSSGMLFWCAFKYPLLSVKIIGLIHWQAFLLWVRRVPFIRKDERREAQKDVLRPHSSLTEKLP